MASSLKIASGNEGLVLGTLSDGRIQLLRRIYRRSERSLNVRKEGECV